MTKTIKPRDPKVGENTMPDILKEWHDSWTLLENALQHNNVEEFKRLFSKEDFNFQDERGSSYLHQAFSLDRWRICEYLLSQLVSSKDVMTYLDKHAQTPLCRVSHKPSINMQLLLQDHDLWDMYISLREKNKLKESSK